MPVTLLTPTDSTYSLASSSIRYVDEPAEKFGLTLLPCIRSELSQHARFVNVTLCSSTTNSSTFDRNAGHRREDIREQ